MKLTDADGKPFVGSTVLSIFDKSVEYISGGTNVGDIKEFFWKWRRQHRPYVETNLDRWFANLVPPGQKGMENLGVFGDQVADRMRRLANRQHRFDERRSTVRRWRRPESHDAWRNGECRRCPLRRRWTRSQLTRMDAR